MEIDCHGVEIMGSDDDGCWYGTEHAWIVLGDPDTSGCDENGKPNGSRDGMDHPPATPHYFEASGYLGAAIMQMYVIASTEQHVQNFAHGLGVVDLTISRGEAVERDLLKDCVSSGFVVHREM